VYDDITSRPLTTPHHSVLDLLPRIHTPFPRQKDRKENRFATLSPSLSPLRTVNHRYRPLSGPLGHPADLTSRPLDHLADFTSTHLDQIAASLRPPQTDVKRRLGRASDHRAFRSTCWKLSESALGVSRQTYLEDISATAFLGALVFALPCPTAAAGLSLGRSVLDIVTGTTKVGLAAVDCDVR